MRLRTALAGLAALAAVAAGQAPASAVTSLSVTITFQIGCFGCPAPSPAQVTGTCTGHCEWAGSVCTGVCSFTGAATVHSTPAACPVAVTMSGTFSYWGGTSTFTLTGFPGSAIVSLAGGGSGAGAFVAPACGAPGTAVFAGHIAGP